MMVKRNVVSATAWVLPKMKKRMDRVSARDPRLTLSRQLNDAIEHGITIEQFEERVGIKRLSGPLTQRVRGLE